MTSSDAAQRTAPGVPPRAAQRTPTVITWQGGSPATLESTRLLVTDSRLRASGRLIAAATADREAYSASFEAAVDKGEASGRLLLRTTTADEERQISLSRTEDGVWLVDHGTASERGDFSGAVAVDVAGAVTFTTLPIRRLGVHREAGEFEIPVVRVSMPDLSVSLVTQVFRTVSLDEGGAVVAIGDPGSPAEVRVDADGIVVDFPGTARRV
ncbi:putative glycolipid-binding domain-containing protein [Actinokineospora bangkokensis]|uniref:Glycolipid-binding domain-containing protein n=1 Tax=Actinokineospora bangkokensis TaxID=1193682 RepID=A0A1Q9LHC0_9PSEU|nr:putative glycolipid-binding domain-containing protein [Actinokineospora bangkokensis]OLR91442.1 hypothetical protein BJP25_00985 [Actinokineospora bangkokensis]